MAIEGVGADLIPQEDLAELNEILGNNETEKLTDTIANGLISGAMGGLAPIGGQALQGRDIQQLQIRMPDYSGMPQQPGDDALATGAMEALAGAIICGTLGWWLPGTMPFGVGLVVDGTRRALGGAEERSQHNGR